MTRPPHFALMLLLALTLPACARKIGANPAAGRGSTLVEARRGYPPHPGG